MNYQGYITSFVVGAILAVVIMLTQCSPSPIIRESIKHTRTTDTQLVALPLATATKYVTLRPQTDADASRFGTAVSAGCDDCKDSLGNLSRDCKPAPFVAEDVTAFGLDTLRTAFAYPQSVFTYEIKRVATMITNNDSTTIERESVKSERMPFGIGLHIGYGVNRFGQFDWVASVGFSVNLLQFKL